MDFRHRKNSFLFKSFSTFLIVSFAINQVVFGNPIEVKTASSPLPGVTAGLEDFVTVSDIYSPQSRTSTLSSILQNKHAKAVIYIEDAHGNISAQRNIAAALEAVSEEAKLASPWIALEGTRVGEVDHRILSAFPDEAIRKKTSEYFLLSGEIDGADYYTATANPKARIFGVDDPVLAEKNRESYRQYLEVRPETERALEHLRQTADFLKKKIYYGDLVLWDSSVQKFEHNPNHFLKHLAVLEELAKKNQLSLSAYPHIRDLIELKTLEAKTTQNGLSKDIRAFQDQSRMTGLDPDQILKLWRKDPSVFDAFPELKGHARFLELSSQLEGVPVFREVAEATSALWDKLLSYREARDVFDIDQTVSFYEKLFDFSLLPEEYAHYLKNTASFSLDPLSEKIADYNFLLHPKTLRPTSEEISRLKGSAGLPLSFYETAEKRNEYLTNNLLSLLAQNPDQKAFFIAGGFHKQALTQGLKAKKISYIVLSPKISDSKGSDAYWKRMGGATTRLDLALAALSTIKEEQSLVHDPFRAKVGLLELGMLQLVEGLSDEGRKAVLDNFTGALSPQDRRTLEILVKSLRDKKDVGVVEAKLAGQTFDVKLSGPDGSPEIVQGASLGGLISVDMNKVSAMLEGKGLNPDQFKGFMINPLPPASAGPITYDYFRNKVLEVLVQTANQSGLKINLPVQRALLDQIFSGKDRERFEVVLRHIESPEALSFEFNSSSYLFEGGVKEKRILINAPALQSMTSDLALNALFVTVVFYHLFYHGGRGKTDESAKIFYRILNTLVQGVETQKKLKIGYQGDAVEKWFSSIVENNVEDAESTNMFSNIVRTINRSGFAPGMVLKNRFKILRFLDQGGMGAVWQAEDLENNNLVVVKQVLPDALQNQAMRARFYREIRALGRNQHNPHIAKLISKQIPDEQEAGQGDERERIYYVMEWAPGESLDKLAQKGDLTLENKIDIVIQLLRGLDQVHNTSTIHRDLKPLNIKVDTQNHNFVRFFDFGLARQINEPDDTQTEKEMTVTQAGDVIGTPHYMSPEQAIGAKDKISYTSDIFAVGSILYKLVTGKYPFNGNTTNAILVRVASDSYEPLGPEVPPALREIIQKAMKKEPQDRYQTAGDFAQALENFLKEEGGSRIQQSEDLRLLSAARQGTGRVNKIDTGKKKPIRSFKPHEARPAASAKKSGVPMAWIAGGGAVLVAAVGGLFLFGGHKPEPKPPVDNPPVVVQKEDPAEIARKQEEERQRVEREKKLAEQQKLSSEIGDVIVKIGELDGIAHSIDQTVESMKKRNAELKALSEKAPQSLDNIPGLEQMNAAVEKGKKDLENQAFLAEQGIKDFDQKIREIREAAKALLARPNISEIQQSQVNALLTGLGTKQAEMDQRRKRVVENQVEPDTYIEQVKNALAAAKDPVRGKEIMVNAEIKRIKGLVAELLKNGDLKALDDSLTPLADLKTRSGDKSKELIKLYGDVTAEVVRQSKLTDIKDDDRKKLSDMEAKLQPLTDEFRVLTDSIPAALKAAEDQLAPLNDQIAKIDKSVAAAGEVAKNDAKFADRLAEAQNEASKAKPVRDALATRKAAFDKAASDLKDRSLAAALDVKIAAGKLAVTRVETVWGKANTDPKWNELRKPYSEAVAAADAAVKDPKTPKTELQAKKDELATAKQALTDFNKKIADARDLQKGIPGILSDFKSGLGIPETRKSGLAEKLSEFRSLLDTSKPTPQQLTRLDVLRTELTQVLNANADNLAAQALLKKSSDILTPAGVSLDFGSQGGLPIFWKWDSKKLSPDIVYLGNGSDLNPEKRDLYLIDVDQKTNKTFFYKNPAIPGHGYILLPQTVSWRNDTLLSVDASLRLDKVKDDVSAISIGFYNSKSKNSSFVTFSNPNGGSVWWKTEHPTAFPNGKYGYLTATLGDNIGTIPINEWFDIKLSKSVGSNNLSIFVNGKEIKQVSMPDADYQIMMLLQPHQRIGTKDDTPKISKIIIKGKSLGDGGEAISRQFLKSAFLSEKPNVIMLPYDEKIVEAVYAHRDILLALKNSSIFFYADPKKPNKKSREFLVMEKMFGIHLVILKQNVFQYTKNELLDFLKRNELTDHRLSSEVLPVIFRFPELDNRKPLQIKKANNHEIINLQLNLNKFTREASYVNVSFVAASALSAGWHDMTLFRVNEDGSFSLSQSLIEMIESDLMNYIAIAKAA